ncbi:MAG: GNAT family N-acetyltransferase [Oligoflexia bacterium]|nr:GNAT family N-acetyltransferase [Oligoflexia bacterium]
MHAIISLKSEGDWGRAFPVLKALRSGLTLEKFLGSRERMLRDGYHLFGLESGGRIVCVASAVVYPHVTHHSDCWVHDLSTLEEERGKGFGQAIMQEIEKFALTRKCARILVHTSKTRTRAQNFYARHLGYDGYAIVYKKELV